MNAVAKVLLNNEKERLKNNIKEYQNEHLYWGEEYNRTVLKLSELQEERGAAIEISIPDLNKKYEEKLEKSIKNMQKWANKYAASIELYEEQIKLMKEQLALVNAEIERLGLGEE